MATLDSTQRAALATDIAARAACAPFRTPPINAPAIAAIYNGLTTAPVVQLWRPDVKVSELNAVANWVAFAALTAIKQNTYFALIQGGVIDTRLASVRAGFAQVWTVAGDQTPLTTVSQRVATILEALFSASNVSVVYGQTLTAEDVHAALGV